LKIKQVNKKHFNITEFNFPIIFLIFGILVISFVFFTCGEEDEEDTLNVENAQYWYNKGNYEKAIEKYKEIVDEQPNNLDAKLGLGWSYLKNNDIENAKKEINGIIKLDKSNIEANLALLGAYLASPSSEINRFKLAIKAGQTILENVQEDYISTYDKEIGLKKIKLSLSQAYLYDGQIEQAQKQMGEISETDLTNLEDLIDEISNLSIE